ncbi:MAG: hypothetical protein IT318_27630 [Anaerolineales bacterium]|nr:hypothetical protein [Anaerolineales bacterium]
MPKIFVLDGEQTYTDTPVPEPPEFGVSEQRPILKSSWEISPIAQRTKPLPFWLPEAIPAFQGVGPFANGIPDRDDRVFTMISLEYLSALPDLGEHHSKVSAEIKIWLPMPTFERVWTFCERHLGHPETVFVFQCDVDADDAAWRRLEGTRSGILKGQGNFSIVARASD